MSGCGTGFITPWGIVGRVLEWRGIWVRASVSRCWGGQTAQPRLMGCRLKRVRTIGVGHGFWLRRWRTIGGGIGWGGRVEKGGVVRQVRSEQATEYAAFLSPTPHTARLVGAAAMVV